MAKKKIKGHVRINAYAVVSRAVEEGVAYGWMRAHKHTAEPSEEAARWEMEGAVMGAICEVVDFGGGGDDE